MLWIECLMNRMLCSNFFVNKNLYDLHLENPDDKKKMECLKNRIRDTVMEWIVLRGFNFRYFIYAWDHEIGSSVTGGISSNMQCKE